MKSTREQVLDLLRQQGEQTIAELASGIGIAAPALRRHLDILAGEALVESRAVRQHTGRPYFAYRLTDRAKERLANSYPRLVERLLREVLELDDGGGAGSHLMETLLERMGEHLAEDYRDRVVGETIEERSASLTLALADEGILEELEVRADGVHLINSSCPHRRAATASDAVCRSEHRAIAMLLDAPVEQLSRIADGGLRCEYLVTGPLGSRREHAGEQAASCAPATRSCA